MAPSIVATLRDRNLSKTPSNVCSESIVRHIYAYLLDGEYHFQDLPVLNSQEIKVLEALKNVSREFQACYSDNMSELSDSLDVTPETIGKVILGVTNELFCEGITWSRIATFYVFGSVTVIQSLHRGYADSIVQTVLNCLLNFTTDFLEKWIFDHGGWEGMELFAKGYKKAESAKVVESQASNSWAKCALYKTVQVLGTLAYLANITQPQDSSL